MSTLDAERDIMGQASGSKEKSNKVKQVISRVVVMGVEGRSLGIAALLSLRGCDVHLFDPDPEKVEPIASAGGVTIEGELGEGLIPLSLATSDVSDACSGRQLFMCCTPAYDQLAMASFATPFMKRGAIFLLATGSAGSLEVSKLFRESGIDPIEDVLLGETSNMPQSGRIIAPGKIRTRSPNRVRLAAFPAINNQRLSEAIEGIIDYCPSPNVLDTGINNVNFIIHPGPMLLNYAAVERADGYLSLMNEGMTECVLRLMDALDAEKMALSVALGLRPSSIDDLYIEYGSSPSVYREKGEPFGIRDRIWDRYITEDTPFGTVMFSSLGKLLGVPTPIADAINHILSVVEQSDFYAKGRTVERLGLTGLTVDEIQYYLQNGVNPK